MPTYPAYSLLFSTIYDEQKPIGNLGRGTHYSVFRCAEWFDVIRRPLQKAQIHDFSVIWDEDHDTRIFNVIERLYVAGLLSPIQFIGERKAMLTVIVAAKFYYIGSVKDLNNYQNQVADIAKNVENDCWSVDVGSFDRAEGDHQCDTQGIIAASEYKVLTYLKNIDNLWSLGTREFVQQTPFDPNFIPPLPVSSSAAIPKPPDLYTK